MRESSLLIPRVMVSRAQRLAERFPHADAETIMIIALQFGLDVIEKYGKVPETPHESLRVPKLKVLPTPCVITPVVPTPVRTHAPPPKSPEVTASVPVPKPEPEAKPEDTQGKTGSQTVIFVSRSSGTHANGTPLKDLHGSVETNPAPEAEGEIRGLSTPAPAATNVMESHSKLNSGIVCSVCDQVFYVDQSTFGDLYVAKRRFGTKPRCDKCGGNANILAKLAS